MKVFREIHINLIDIPAEDFIDEINQYLDKNELGWKSKKPGAPGFYIFEKTTSYKDYGKINVFLKQESFYSLILTHIIHEFSDGIKKHTTTTSSLNLKNM